MPLCPIVWTATESVMEVKEERYVKKGLALPSQDLDTDFVGVCNDWNPICGHRSLENAII